MASSRGREGENEGAWGGMGIVVSVEEGVGVWGVGEEMGKMNLHGLVLHRTICIGQKVPHLPHSMCNTGLGFLKSRGLSKVQNGIYASGPKNRNCLTNTLPRGGFQQKRGGSGVRSSRSTDRYRPFSHHSMLGAISSELRNLELGPSWLPRDSAKPSS
eukprot:763936-Hanusia_phi.AAC.1